MILQGASSRLIEAVAIKPMLVIRNANQKGIAFVQILIISVTVIVVAVPEGTFRLGALEDGV